MTTAAGGDYGSGSGTSFAVPVVTGMAALVISANSALTGVEAMNILKQSTDDLGAPGWDATYGSGRVNALKAVQAAISAGAIDSTAPTAQITSPASGAVVSGSVMINVTASYNVGVTGVAL